MTTSWGRSLNRVDFEEAVKQFKAGDWVKLVMQGPYGRFLIDGFLVKVEDGKVYLDYGAPPHDYLKIVAIEEGVGVNEV